MAYYEEGLRGGVSLFRSSRSVEREEWVEYARSLAIEERYPGIRGIGFVRPVAAGEEQRFLARVRADAADFVIHDVRRACRDRPRARGRMRYVVSTSSPCRATSPGAGWIWPRSRRAGSRPNARATTASPP